MPSKRYLSKLLPITFGILLVASCQKEVLAPEDGGATGAFTLSEFDPSDQIAWELISGFKESRQSMNKKPWNDMKIDQAVWLLEAAANEEKARADLPFDAVSSHECAAPFALTCTRVGSNYWASGADLLAIYNAVAGEAQTIFDQCQIKHGAGNANIIAVDLEIINTPPSPMPSSIVFEVRVTTVMGIVMSGASALFTCEYGANDDWEWWNEGNPTKIGNCTLGTGPGVDATMKIEQGVRRCVPVGTCRYYTNISGHNYNPIALGRTVGDPTVDNYYDYPVFINYSGTSSYHGCLNEIEMDFYRDQAISIGIDSAIVGKDLFITDLVGYYSSGPFGDTKYHQLVLRYGKCRGGNAGN